MTTPNHDQSDKFRIIENEDAGLRYSEGWNVIIPDPREKRVGVAWTDRAKASVEVQFYGTSISIHGRIFENTCNDGAFVVSLDGDVVRESTSTPQNSGAVLQQVFSTPSVALSNHTLTLTMRAGGVPLYLDYFNVTLDVGSGSTDVSTLASNTNTTFPNSAATAVSVLSTIDPILPFSTSHPITPVGGIVGGVLGGIVFVAVGILWVALRRRKRKAEREDDVMDKEFERVVPGWKRDPEKKGGSGSGGERGRGTTSGKSKTHRGSKGESTSHSRGHKPPRLKPITFAKYPEDGNGSDSPASVSRVVNLKQEGYKGSPLESLPPISPVSPFHEAEFGGGEVRRDGRGLSMENGARVSGTQTRERGDGVYDEETQARGYGEVSDRLWGDATSAGLATVKVTGEGREGEEGIWTVKDCHK